MSNIIRNTWNFFVVCQELMKNNPKIYFSVVFHQYQLMDCLETAINKHIDHIWEAMTCTVPDSQAPRPLKGGRWGLWEKKGKVCKKFAPKTY